MFADFYVFRESGWSDGRALVSGYFVLARDAESRFVRATLPDCVGAIRVGFIPVTCHLTCPVTDFINKQMTGGSEFEPVRFQGWPELKEAFISGYLPATFILAPLAMRLREDGVPIKIVYLGHRDGTALVVNRESQIFQIEDLRGKTIAVPNRFSNQKLLVVKALQQHGVPLDQVKIVECQGLATWIRSNT